MKELRSKNSEIETRSRPRLLVPTLVALPSYAWHAVVPRLGDEGELLVPFAPLKLVRYPRSLAPTLVTLPSMSRVPRAPFNFYSDAVHVRVRTDGDACAVYRVRIIATQAPAGAC